MIKEEILKRIVPILDQTQEGILKVADILKEQVPQLVEEIYRWNFVTSFILFCVGVTILGLTIWGTVRLLKYFNKNNSLEEGGILLIFLVFPLAIGFAFICSNCAWLKILLAPKLYLIEYITTLIGK